MEHHANVVMHSPKQLHIPVQRVEPFLEQHVLLHTRPIGSALLDMASLPLGAGEGQDPIGTAAQVVLFLARHVLLVKELLCFIRARSVALFLDLPVLSHSLLISPIVAHREDLSQVHNVSYPMGNALHLRLRQHPRILLLELEHLPIHLLEHQHQVELEPHLIPHHKHLHKLEQGLHPILELEPQQGLLLILLQGHQRIPLLRLELLHRPLHALLYGLPLPHPVSLLLLDAVSFTVSIPSQS